ncbi:Rap guanine nucleotide exchange factor 3 [Saguinus oedipus]|uniref:Rap guanine nucleotide exchange factor 3 n=1 Tax=Saguinus oedipus TaxID=9490 RepID=A0ABQ9UY14_SAGOE|nr:Rap guanine nucleotide exchange factor 3 [Saguinus oedipus]
MSKLNYLVLPKLILLVCVPRLCWLAHPLVLPSLGSAPPPVFWMSLAVLCAVLMSGSHRSLAPLLQRLLSWRKLACLPPFLMPRAVAGAGSPTSFPQCLPFPTGHFVSVLTSPQLEERPSKACRSHLETTFPQLSLVSSSVPYDICRPDHSVLTLQLPVTASVREMMATLAQEDGWTKGQVLVKDFNPTTRRNSLPNSTSTRVSSWSLASLPSSTQATSAVFADAVGLQPDACVVATSLGLNERLFVVNPQEVHELHSPTCRSHILSSWGPLGSAEGLDLVSAKDLAGQLTNHNWSLFNSIHQVELIHYVLGPQHLRDITTANLEHFMRRFNELHLKEQKNLSSFFAIMFGLSDSAISRLAHTWEQLPHKVRKLYSALERLLDPSWNHRVYRLALAKLSTPVIPFMPLFKGVPRLEEELKHQTNKGCF